MSPSALRRRALLSGTMLVAATVGYGRRAYGACAPTVAPNYQCSGANATTQTINAKNASVSTVSGFSVNTAAGNAITITGNGALSYTDTNASSLTAVAGTALDVRSLGDDVGTSTPGSITIGTNGTLSGRTGIFARNDGTGALTITANGDVTGTNVSMTIASGIYARNTVGTDLSVTTAAGTTVSGRTGIFARNDGTGAVSITANGNVTSTFANSIAARSSGTELSVTTAAGTTVRGANSGIAVSNYGSGALTVTTNGNVTGRNRDGISAFNLGAGTALSVTTGAGTTVSGGSNGIYARNYGTGALTITANGNVTGTFHSGIYATNSSAGTNLSVTTGAGSTVSRGRYGIYARNWGTGALTITVNGNVTGNNAGIYIYAGAATVTVAGTVTGGGGTAIRFDQTNAVANRLELVTGAVINGIVLGGTGTDTLALTGTGTGSFDAGLIGPGQQYQNFEAFQKDDTGTWTLTGTNTLMLPWTVAQGTLVVNANMTNAPFTVTGGVLAGTGTVGNTLVSGGTFAPGSGTPGSSMTVNGSLAFQSGALYLVQINSAASTFSNVTGTATLAGTVQVTAPTNSFRFNSPYTILTSAGLGGTQFNALTTPAGTTGSLIYSGGNVQLNLASGLGQLPGLNVNQHNVAAALDSVFNASGNTGGLGAIFVGNIAQNLTQVSGETATGTQQTTFDAMTQFLGVMTDPFIGGRGDGATGGAGATPFAEEDSSTSAYAASSKRSKREHDAYAMFTKAPLAKTYDPRWSVWAAGFGGSQTTDGNATLGSNTATSRLFGTAVGADYRFSPFTLAGFALAGGGTNFGVAGGGTGRSDLFQAGAFVRHTVGPAYIAAALAYGWQDITTDRTVTVAGIDQLRAKFNANAWSGRVEGGYRFVSPWVGGIGITPYSAGQFTTFDLPAYAEQAIAGSNQFALGYGAKSVTDTRSELGIRTDKSFAMQSAILTLRGRLAWAHDFDPDRNIAATFQALPGASFVVNGAAQAHDSALTTASAELKWQNGWSAAATFEGEFSSVTRSYAGKGVARYSW
jgi:uncharacterized protein with beta-barrel porin domain